MPRRVRNLISEAKKNKKQKTVKAPLKTGMTIKIIVQTRTLFRVERGVVYNYAWTTGRGWAIAGQTRV